MRWATAAVLFDVVHAGTRVGLQIGLHVGVRVGLCEDRGMPSIGTVVLGVADLRRALDFWSRALGYVPRDGEVEDDWVVLVPPDGGPGARLALGLSETPARERPRVHLDLYAGDASPMG